MALRVLVMRGGGCRALMAAKPSYYYYYYSTSSSSAKTPSSRAEPLLKAVPVSPSLAKFLGAPEVSRGDAVKKVWEYIKLHHLQNPKNKREILCDVKLKTIFDGKDKVGFLEVSKLLSQHFVKKTS